MFSSGWHHREAPDAGLSGGVDERTGNAGWKATEGEVFDRFADAACFPLAGGPLPHRELEHRVLAAPLRIRVPRDALGELVRLAIKWLWESGELMYRNAADSLYREHRKFHLTQLAHPALQLNHIDTSQAIQLLLRRYLAAFGPASIDDFQWWSGLTRSEIIPALAALRPELTDVRFTGQPEPLLLLAEHETRLLATAPSRRATV